MTSFMDFMSFPSYSSPIDRISTHGQNDIDLAWKSIPMTFTKSLGACLSMEGSTTTDEVTPSISASISPSTDEVCIEFPMRGFEDFYLHNVPSPEFHVYGDGIFDFRGLVTHTESLLSLLYNKARVPSKIVEVIAAYRDDEEESESDNEKELDRELCIENAYPYDAQEIVRRKLSIPTIISLNLVHILVSDRYGSRYLQSLLRSFEPSVCCCMITLVLNALIASGTDLIGMSEDIYGNYLIQLFLAEGNESHHNLLLNSVLYPSIFSLCKSKYGCRVVQKAFDCIGNVDNICKLIESFKEQSNGSYHECLICCNTNHVIQKMIELRLPFSSMEFIRDALDKDLVGYSENVYSCRVVQSFVSVYGDKLNVTKLFTDDSHLFLCRVKYGNYVIQCIVKNDEWYSSLPLMIKFRNKLISDVFTDRNILYLSKNKHASNVIETCICVSNDDQLDALVHTICLRKGFLLRNMISNRYGNYVPTTLLQNCNAKQKRIMVNTVHSYITNLYHHHHRGYHQSAKRFIQICQEIKYNIDNHN